MSPGKPPLAAAGDPASLGPEDLIVAVGRASATRDPYTAAHHERVGRLAAAIARQMNLDHAVVKGITLAASIHDLGKLGVPLDLLMRSGALTGPEFQVVQAHSQAGYDILGDVPLPWPISQMILQHHERRDGSGYPYGLRGDEIHLGSMIVAVADVFEAMTAHRPYRLGLGAAIALETLTEGHGAVFHPDVVEACVQCDPAALLGTS